MDEKLGSPDPLAEQIAKLPNVSSCEVTDVRRAIGWSRKLNFLLIKLLSQLMILRG